MKSAATDETCRECGHVIEYSEQYGAYRVTNAGGPATFCRPSPVGLHIPAGGAQ